VAHKLLVANRGEIACRIIRAAQALSIPTVAVYSDADETAPHVAMADEKRRLGPARAQDSYLNQDAVLLAARDTDSTLIHPGYGFLAENSGFAARCAREGIVFVGPSPETIAAMGDKERARSLAIAAGVPVLPGTGRLSEDMAVIARAAEAIGFPLLVKAAAGGGGIGMRLVANAAALEAAVTATVGLAQRAFGNGAVYLERYVARARHVEVQVFGFGNGQAAHLFDRDCSIQRRHQKVIEEALAPGLDEATRSAMCRVAVELARSCRYDGAGTVEFLYDEETKAFYFLEMNTRIQVEHGVTELVTGVDLVGAQIEHAMGRNVVAGLTQTAIRRTGHAIEARIYAEDPTRRFMPCPGAITRLELPQAPGIRIDTGFRSGSVVTPFYDPMVMKVMAHADSRIEAIDRLADALSRLVIGGIMTNLGFLRAVLAHPEFRAAKLSTDFLIRHESALLKHEHKDVEPCTPYPPSAEPGSRKWIKTLKF
jgi:acetyl/propionyl-CoA carboxylase alpha subunit